MTNDMIMNAETDRQKDEERKRQENFARRRADPEYVKYGVDECGATGGGHGSMQLQSDGRRYCEYCGAECLPEHVKEWESDGSLEK
jgi:hypothetical protein